MNIFLGFERLCLLVPYYLWYVGVQVSHYFCPSTLLYYSNREAVSLTFSQLVQFEGKLKFPHMLKDLFSNFSLYLVGIVTILILQQ